VLAGKTPVLVHNSGCWVGTGGPGNWGTVAESMKARALAYQIRVTGGVPSGMGYKTIDSVGEVHFDSFQDGILIEAKGPGYAGLTKNGRFYPGFGINDSAVAQAERQLRVSGGLPVEWRVAEPIAVQAFKNLFADNGIVGINVVYVP
jgi:hypothetical protein